MLTGAISDPPSLEALRRRAAWFFAGLLWLHVPIVALIARSNHMPALSVAASMAIAAAIGTAAARLWGGGVAARCTIAAAFTAAPALMVYAGAGAWEIDWHMYFFVVFGMLVAFVDWRPIAVSAALTAFHHMVLTLVFPSTVFPQADLARVALHVGIVLVDALVLFWIVRQMKRLFSRSAAAVRVAQGALQRAELLQSAVVNANDAIIIYEFALRGDADAAASGRRVVYTNAAFTHITQYGSAQVAGQSLAILCGKKTATHDVERCFAAAFRGEASRFVGIFYARDGREFDAEVSLVGVPGSNKDVLRAIAVMRDVTATRIAREAVLRAELAEENNVALEREVAERRTVEGKLAFASGHDSVTGLPNRGNFRARLAEALVEGHATGSPLGVLLVDIDRFKSVNDALGHIAGDSLLVAVAKRLGHCLREKDTLARLGADEFMILIEAAADGDGLEGIAQRLLASFAAPFVLLEREVYATASIGIARVDGGSAPQADDLMRNADLAMYHAKSLGKARYEMYVPELLERSLRLSRVENDLQGALERSEIAVFYQPIVLLKNERVCGFEALARWRHPIVGMIPPSEFIPIAENTGIIVELGQCVLEAACATLRSWLDAFPEHAGLWISVNVSPLQLSVNGYLTTVLETLERHAIPAQSLHLEMTEYSIVRNLKSLGPMLASLRERGVHISIDDFGTGYSSLQFLDVLPVDTLKIDRSFVSGRGDGIANIKIVRTIVNFAKDLGLAVITEGIETIEQAQTMCALTNAYGQGYLFGRPLEAAAAFALLGAAQMRTNPLPVEHTRRVGRRNELVRRKPA